MTNIDGHSLVDCGGLWWLGAISSVLPMCHVHVAVFALGCEATYISIIPKIPKKSSLGHIFIKYVKILPCLVQNWFNNIHFPILFTTTLYEGSAIYIFLIALGIFGHSFLSKSLPHDKIQLHLPSKSSSANFQSFCSTRTVVKEVLARHILMSWIFATSSIFPNHSSPQNLSPI